MEVGKSTRSRPVCTSLGLAITGFEPEAVKALTAYSWPGNIRELENVVERAMVLTHGDRIGEGDLPDSVRDPKASLKAAGGNLSSDELSVKKRSWELEKHLIGRALEVTGGNRTRAAELLDLSYRALLYKIRDYGLVLDVPSPGVAPTRRGSVVQAQYCAIRSRSAGYLNLL